MLAEVKERCLQVFDACDSSESFPGNGLDLVLTEVSADRKVPKRKQREGEKVEMLLEVFPECIECTVCGVKSQKNI